MGSFRPRRVDAIQALKWQTLRRVSLAISLLLVPDEHGLCLVPHTACRSANSSRQNATGLVAEAD